MPLQPCVRCKREISTQLARCPHCRKRNPTRKKKGLLHKGWFWLLVLISVSVAAWEVESGGPPSGPVENPKVTAYRQNLERARVACVDQVSQTLRLPADVEFQPNYEQRADTTKRGTWTVSGYFDAENRVGANRRTTYDCEIRFLRSGVIELVKLRHTP